MLLKVVDPGVQFCTKLGLKSKFFFVLFATTNGYFLVLNEAKIISVARAFRNLLAKKRYMSICITNRHF